MGKFILQFVCLMMVCIQGSHEVCLWCVYRMLFYGVFISVITENVFTEGVFMVFLQCFCRRFVYVVFT